VDNEKATGPKLADAAEDMLRSGFLDGLTRLLEDRFRGVREVFYEDAVAESVKKLLEAGERREIANPRAYITTIALNEMRHQLRRAALEQLPQPSEDDDEDAWMVEGQAGDGRPTEDIAVGQAVYEHVKTMVERWDSRNLRVTTLVVLESAYLGEALAGEELAERLSEIFDEDVLESTARQWKKRGLDRLRHQLVAEGYPVQD
jgi:DNA-directed RNA polymerase specialized sigma24 family protein